MPFDFKLDDVTDEKSIIKANVVNQTYEGGPIRTTQSQESEPRTSLTTYGLSNAMQGIALYKPQGVTYDAFNNHLSKELESLGTEDKWKDRANKLTPYDVFIKDPTTRPTDAAVGNIANNAATGSSSSNPTNDDPVSGGVAGNGNVKMIWPCTPHPISQPFGNNGHPGLDISVPSGTTLVAPLDGVVTDTNADGRTNPDGYGTFFLYIKHSDDVYTLYGHIKKRLVNAGDVVKQGQPVAISGGAAGDPGAGYSTGAHLHFEVRSGPYGGWGNLSNPTIKNPMNYLEG